MSFIITTFRINCNYNKLSMKLWCPRNSESSNLLIFESLNPVLQVVDESLKLLGPRNFRSSNFLIFESLILCARVFNETSNCWVFKIFECSNLLKSLFHHVCRVSSRKNSNKTDFSSFTDELLYTVFNDNEWDENVLTEASVSDVILRDYVL